MPLREINSKTYEILARAAEDFVNEFQNSIISDTVREIIESSTPLNNNSETDSEIIDENHFIELNNMIGRSAKDLTNDAIKGQIIKTKFGENELASNFLDAVAQASESIIRREALHRQNWFIEQIRHSRIPDSVENYELFTKKLKELYRSKSFSLEGLEQLSKTQLELAKSFEEESIIENIKDRVRADIEEAEVRQTEIVTVMQEVQDTSQEYDDEITENAEEGDMDTEPVEDETDSELKIPDDGVENALDDNDPDDASTADDGISDEAVLKKQVAMNQKKNQADKLAEKLQKARAKQGKESTDFVDTVNNKGKDPDSGPDFDDTVDVGKEDSVDDIFKEYVSDDDPASAENADIQKPASSKGKNPDSGPDVHDSDNVSKADNVDDIFKEYVSDDDPASAESTDFVDTVNNKGKDPDSGPDFDDTVDVGKEDSVDDIFKEYVSDDDPASAEGAINEGESDEDLAAIKQKASDLAKKGGELAKKGASKTKEAVGNAKEKSKQMLSKAKTSLSNATSKTKSAASDAASKVKTTASNVANKVKSKFNKSKEEMEDENPGANPEGIGGMSTYQNRDNFGAASAQPDVPGTIEDQVSGELNDSDNMEFQFGPGDKENPDGKQKINPLRGTGAETENNTNMVENQYDTSTEVLKRLVPLSEIKFTENPIYTPRSISAYLYRIGPNRPAFIEKVEKRLISLEDIIKNSKQSKGLMKKLDKLKDNWKKGQEQAFIYDIEISNMGLYADKINSREDLFALAVAKNILNRYHMKGSGYKLRRITRNPELYKSSMEHLVDHIFTYYYFAHRLDKAKDITLAKEGLALHEEKINGAIYDLTPEDKEKCVNLKNLLADGQLNRLFVTDSLLIDFNNIFSRVKDTTDKPINMLSDVAFKEKVLSNLEKKNLNVTESMEHYLDILIFQKGDPTSIDPPIFTSILTNLSKKHIAKSAESIANKTNRAKIYTEAKVYLTIKRAAEALGLNNSEFEQAFAKEFIYPSYIDGANE